MNKVQRASRELGSPGSPAEAVMVSTVWRRRHFPGGPSWGVVPGKVFLAEEEEGRQTV